MSSKRAQHYKGQRERIKRERKEESTASKQRRRIQVLEARKEELLEINRKLQRHADRVPGLERRVAELEGGYRLGLRETEDKVQAVIARGQVIVWEGRLRRSLRPRDMWRARRVLAAFRRSDP